MTKNQAVEGFLDPSPCGPKSRVHLHVFAFELHLIMQFLQISTVIPVEPHHRLDKRVLLFFVKILFCNPERLQGMKILLVSRSRRNDNGRYLLI